MKKLLSLVLLLTFFFIHAHASPIQIGSTLPDFSVPLADQPSLINQSILEGKITIIEFWATWCSPCHGAMEKLDQLQKQYSKEVQVLAVSQESFGRIQRFIKKKDYDFTYLIDSAAVLNNFFPHRIIPHAVIIDQKGVVRAITEPSQINSVVIQKLLAQETINLPIKTENIDFDYADDYFKADINTESSFVIQPSIPGVGTFSKVPRQGPFADRRISLHNFMIDGLYREAYQMSTYRVAYDMDKTKFNYDNPTHKFCVDLIVKPGKQQALYPTFIKNLEESFPIKAKKEQRTKEVAVLYRIDSLPLNLAAAKSEGQQKLSSNAFQHFNARFSDLAQHLEDYGIVGMAVLDETNDANFYQIDFQFLPEEQGAFQAGLREMGLGIRKATRTIEVLVLSEE